MNAKSKMDEAERIFQDGEPLQAVIHAVLKSVSNDPRASQGERVLADIALHEMERANFLRDSLMNLGRILEGKIQAMDTPEREAHGG
jgi:hypothetical protein